METSETTCESEPQTKSQTKESTPIHSKQKATTLSQFAFKDMRLKIGDKLHIKLSSKAMETSQTKRGGYLMASLIGYYENRSLLISAPGSYQITGCPFVEEDKLEICFFSGKTLFKFTSYVDKINSVPFKYLHLSIPKDITGQTVRKSRRINVNIEATVSPSTQVIITDISETGAKIEANSEIGKPGDTIALTFEVNTLDNKTPLTLKAIIRIFNLAHSKKHPLCYGIEFANLHHDQFQVLRDLIYQQIIDGCN